MLSPSLLPSKSSAFSRVSKSFERRIDATKRLSLDNAVGWEDEEIRDDPWLKSRHERDYESNYEYFASAITGGLNGMG